MRLERPWQFLLGRFPSASAGLGHPLPLGLGLG